MGMEENRKGKPENEALQGKGRCPLCEFWRGGEAMGDWLVGVTAAGNIRVMLQTLSSCLDSELCCLQEALRLKCTWPHEAERVWDEHKVYIVNIG